DQVGAAALPQVVEQRLAARQAVDLEILVLEVEGQRLPDDRIVVDDEDAGVCVHSMMLTGPWPFDARGCAGSGRGRRPPGSWGRAPIRAPPCCRRRHSDTDRLRPDTGRDY